ncbi:MAG: hypothetical protein ACXAEN_18755 [Candidatus Thorarchaeota archaeon]|jgi:hypothetical protein
MDMDKILRDLDIDMKEKLKNILKSKDLSDLASTLIKSMGTQKMATLLCDRTYFSTEQVVKALDKMGGKRSKLQDLLEEPKNESQMKESVAADLRSKKFKCAYEVPLPKTGSKRSRKIDVAGYRKGVFGGLSVIGVELKSKPTTAAIDGAFGQAKDYSDWCEESVVCFSPLVYLKQSDRIESKMKKDRRLGVWIVSKRRVVKPLQEATATSIPDKNQQEMKDYIDSGKC